MPSLISSLNLFNAVGSDGKIKFYEYPENGSYFGSLTSQLLFDKTGDINFKNGIDGSITRISIKDSGNIIAGDPGETEELLVQQSNPGGGATGSITLSNCKLFKVESNPWYYNDTDHGSNKETDCVLLLSAGWENRKSIIYLGTPFRSISGKTLGPPKIAIIAEGKTTNSRADLRFCVNTTQNNESIVTESDSKMMIKYDNGNVGIGDNFNTPTAKLHIKHTADNDGITIHNVRSGTNFSEWRIGTTDNMNFLYNGANRGYLKHDGNNNNFNFTGQHRSMYKEETINNIKNMEGLIVSANKDSYTSMSGSITQGLSAITINESLPDISICNKEKDKAVFGVISTTEDTDKREEVYGSFVTPFEKEVGDTRPYINSLGEGAIWVSNKNGDLESGDYITSSSIPGYGMKQDDDLLHNYTVAKITMNCNFAPQTVPKRIILKDSNGDNILDSNGYIQFVDHSSETELKYNIRYLQSDGTIITESDYNTRLGNGESVYKAAFVGCTYHCG